jgi:hypothetical protein
MKRIINLGILACFALTACQKDVNKECQPSINGQQETSASANGVPHTKNIYIATVDELYAAVNNADNAGALLVLAPGTYVLNASYPNGGRLDFLKDMSLQGQPGDAEEVVIDATALPNTSFTIPGGFRTGVIRMGNGSNSLEWIKLIAARVALAGIDTEASSEDAYIRVAHSIITNAQNGIWIRNRQTEHLGRKLEADIAYNEFTGNTAGNGNGIVINNAISDASINVNLVGNYIHGNRIGLTVFNGSSANTTLNSVIIIASYSDRFEGNGLGLSIGSGLNQSAAFVAHHNSTTATFYAASIRENNPVPMPPELEPRLANLPKGGIIAYAGGALTANNLAAGNELILSFRGSDISDNHGTDIHAFGSIALPPATYAGENNQAAVHLHGNSVKAILNSIIVFPEGPLNGNTLQVTRNNK